MTLELLSNEIHPSVSLGIVVYNSPLFDLEECFDSIIESSIVPKVYILCNSENETYSNQVKDFCAKYNFEYIRSKNHGFGHGHNRIMSLQNKDWYICCNPDIKLNPITIESMLNVSKNLKNPVQLTPKILNPDGTIQKLSKKKLSLTSWLERQVWRFFPLLIQPYNEKYDYTKTQTVELVTGCFFMIRSELYRKIGGFDEQFFLYCEDADFSRMASKIGINYYIATASVTHKWGKAYTKSYKHLKIVLVSLFKYFKKHGIS